MLVLPQIVEIQWHGLNKQWYVQKGYQFTKIRDKFKVCVLDLMPGSTCLVEVICDFCKKVVNKSFSSYIKSHKENEDCCHNCIGKKTNKKIAKYSFEYVQKEFEKRGFILLETKYINNYTNMKFICNKGHQDRIPFKSLLKGYGCKKCAAEKRADELRMPIEKVKQIFKENGCLLLTEDYIKNNQLLDYICVCGNKDQVSLAHFKNGVRCSECTSKKRSEANRKYNLEDVKKIFEDNGCFLLEKEYINYDIRMNYICVCGRQSKISLGQFLAGGRCKKCAYERISGENHYNWNPNLTQEEREINRHIEGYSEWRKQVYERDNYTCQCCGDKQGGNLNAHHLDGYHWCEEKRTDVDNGVTLCEDCHKNFHSEYGIKNNTKEQFEEWLLTQNNLI